MRRRDLLRLSMAGAVLTAAPRPLRARRRVLRLHHFLSTSSTTHRFVAAWVSDVARASDGELAIEIYPSMQLGGKAPQLVDQVRDGVVDLVWTLPGYTPGRFPIAEVFELPFIPGSAEATSQAIQSFAGKRLGKEMQDFQPIVLHAHAPGVFHLRRDRVQRLEDLNGLRIRAPTRLASEALKALGASPVGMPAPQVPEALMRGVIDGALLPYEVTPSLSVDELSTSHTEIDGPRGLYTAVFLLAMNKAVYEGLPDDLRGVIDAHSGLPLAQRAGRMWNEAERTGRSVSEARKHTFDRITGAERERWKSATEAVKTQWMAEMEKRGLDGSQLVAEADGLIGKFS